MKSLALVTISAVTLAFSAPALAYDCPGKKAMQNAEAAQSDNAQTAEAAAQTPLPADDATVAAPHPAEVAAAPAADKATEKN